MDSDYTLETLKVWRWNNGKDVASWYFVSLPEDITEELHIRFAENKKGFGSLKVEVTCGATTWQTSLFPDKERNSFLLPLKKAVRTAEHIDEDSVIKLNLRVI